MPHRRWEPGDYDNWAHPNPTQRVAMELGYHVTLVRDATAAYKPEMLYASHELNGPAFAHAVLTTEELVAALPKD